MIKAIWAVAIIGSILLGALMTGVEGLFDAGARGAARDRIFLLNSAYCFVGTLFIIVISFGAEKSRYANRIFDSLRHALDESAGFLLLTSVCGVLYLMKIGLIHFFTIPYSHPWTTPILSLVVLLLPPLGVVLLVDFLLSRGQLTASFFRMLRSALYSLLEFLMKLVLAPWRWVVIALSPGKYLHSGKARSPGYEIRMLVNDDYAHSVYYDTQTNTYLIVKSAVNQEIVRIDSSGAIVGRLLGPRSLSAGGLCFGDSDYVDWPVSGDASAHSYAARLRTDKLTDSELTRYLDECECVEFFAGNRVKATRCYLKRAGGWIALETPIDSGDEAAARPPLAELIQAKYRDKLAKRLLLLTALPKHAPGPYAIEGKLHLRRLALSSYLSATYSDFNALSWHGWYGTGIFQLQHRGERLRFKAFAAYADAKYATGLHRYSLPVAYEKASDLVFIKVENDFAGRSTDRPGLYIVRPRTRPASVAGVDGDTATTRLATYRWRPVVKLVPNRGQLVHLQYGNGTYEGMSVPLNIDVHAWPRLLPTEIKFIWNQVFGDYDSRVLYINGRLYRWGGERKYVFGVTIAVSFDDEEIEAAFDKLAAGGPLAVEVAMEHIDNESRRGRILSIRATNGVDAIPLRRAVLGAAAPTPEVGDNAQDIEQYLVKREYEKAVDKIDHVPAFAEVVDFLIAHSQCLDEHAKQVTFYVMKVLFRWLPKNEFATTNGLLSRYIDAWLPRLGANEHTAFIASGGLVLSILQRDNTISDAVFKNILGPRFDISQLTNNHLLLNLACHYAVNHDKERMLVAIKHALYHGAEHDKFRTDADFEDYWQDSDFQKVLSESAPTVKAPESTG